MTATQSKTNRHTFRIGAAILTAVSITACSGSGSGGSASVVTPENSATPVQETPRTFVISNQNGSQALQDALNAAQAGDTIMIQGGSELYLNNFRYPGETIRGFTIANSGTAESPIRITGDLSNGGARPIIDQGQTQIPDSANDATVGIYLLCASHIIIENIEIRNTHSAGISSSIGECESSHISIENMHIHHVYGDRNVGGIRLSRASHVDITNNTIHDIYQTNSDNNYPVISANSNPIEAIIIAQNHFHTIDTGIRLQAQHDQHLTDLEIRANHFNQLETGIAGTSRALTDSSVDNGQLSKLTIQHNLFHTVNSAIDFAVGSSNTQSQDLSIHNNTFHRIESAAISFSGLIDVAIYNNIFSFIERDLLISRAPAQANLSNSLSEMDYNLFWHSSYSAATGPEWLLDIGGTKPESFNSFNQWQTAFSDTLHPQLVSNPDQASQFVDPLFFNADELDFTPQNAFANSGGRHGETLGAFSETSTPGPRQQ